MVRKTWTWQRVLAVFGAAFALGIGLAYYLESVRGNYGPVGMDVYPRWYGARAFWSGVSPYAPVVQEQAELEMFGRPARAGENAFFYSYPAHLAILFYPLVQIPVESAAIVWSAGMWAILVTTIIVWSSTLTPRLTPALWGICLLSGIVFRPASLSAINGQYPLFVVGCLALIFWLQREHEVWAGMLTPLLTIKPSVGLLLPLVLALWALRWKRWRWLFGFILTSFALFGITIWQVGWWVPDFIHQTSSYIPTFRSVALAWSLDDVATPPGVIWLIGSITLIALGGVRVYRHREFPWLALFGTINLNLLFFPHTVEYDLTMLLLPTLWLGARWRAMRGDIWLWLVLIWLPWLSFALVMASGNGIEVWWKGIWQFYPALLVGMVLVVVLYPQMSARRLPWRAESELADPS